MSSPPPPPRPLSSTPTFTRAAISLGPGSTCDGTGFEGVTCDLVMRGIRTGDCAWAHSQPGKHHSLAEAKTRQALVTRLVGWLFSDVVIPLLRCHFYVTETGAHRNRVFYFRRPVWQRLQHMSLASLDENGMFRRVSDKTAKAILGRRTLGYSRIRLLPKLTSMRIIMNMGRRPNPAHVKAAGGTYADCLSVNQQLTNLFHVLTFEKKRQPEPLGASVFGMDDIYKRFKPFVLGLRQPAAEFDGGPPVVETPVFFVSVDVKNCFDTIKQDKLFRIVEDALKSETYLVRRFVTIISAGRRLRKE